MFVNLSPRALRSTRPLVSSSNTTFFPFVIFHCPRNSWALHRSGLLCYLLLNLYSLVLSCFETMAIWNSVVPLWATVLSLTVLSCSVSAQLLLNEANPGFVTDFSPYVCTTRYFIDTQKTVWQRRMIMLLFLLSRRSLQRRLLCKSDCLPSSHCVRWVLRQHPGKMFVEYDSSSEYESSSSDCNARRTSSGAFSP